MIERDEPGRKFRLAVSERPNRGGCEPGLRDTATFAHARQYLPRERLVRTADCRASNAGETIVAAYRDGSDVAERISEPLTREFDPGRVESLGADPLTPVRGKRYALMITASFLAGEFPRCAARGSESQTRGNADMHFVECGRDCEGLLTGQGRGLPRGPVVWIRNSPDVEPGRGTGVRLRGVRPGERILRHRNRQQRIRRGGGCGDRRA